MEIYKKQYLKEKKVIWVLKNGACSELNYFFAFRPNSVNSSKFFNSEYSRLDVPISLISCPMETMCVCLCVYTYIHTHTHPYIHTYMGVCVCMHTCVHECCHFSHVQLFVTLWTIVSRFPQSMGFPRQEYWSGLPYRVAAASSIYSDKHRLFN